MSAKTGFAVRKIRKWPKLLDFTPYLVAISKKDLREGDSIEFVAFFIIINTPSLLKKFYIGTDKKRHVR